MNTRSDKTDEKILITLQNYPKGIGREELAKKMKVARTTVFDSLTRLLIKGKVYQRKIYRYKAGRPKMVWCLTRNVR